MTETMTEKGAGGSPSVFGEFARYTALNVMGMAGLSCYILADTYFISKGLGANGLAALNLAIPVYSFIHGSGLMLGMGGATKYSIYKGQGAGKTSDQVFTQTIWMTVFMAAVFMVLGLTSSWKITQALGGNPEANWEVASMTKTYLTVILLFAPAFMMNDVLICFVRNDGNPRLSMAAMLVGSLSNVALDYIFIFPLGMGILGAVLATGLAPVISMGILSVHIRSKERGFHLKKMHPDVRMAVSGISLGFPSLITEVSSGIVIIVFNKIILELAGNTGIAAYGVIANLSLVVVAIYTGIAQGMQPIISRAYGRGIKKQIGEIVRYGLVTMLVLSVCVYLIVFFFAEPITAVFNSEGNEGLKSIAVWGLKVYFTAVPFVGFNIVISSYFTSVEKALPAHIISLLRGLVLIIPMAFVLSAAAGLTGVWLTFPVTEGLVCLLGVGIWRRK